MNDGGPAFPFTESEEEGHGDFITTTYIHHPGMSLRDYFAAAALQLWGDIYGGSDVTDDMKEAARYCYQVADAMLAEREKKRPI